MAEMLTFHFEGLLADDHTLNFYEASRFQYAAARLLVKLGQFQANGNFVRKITNNSNRNILLKTQKDGSFDISILMPIAQAVQDNFINVSIPNLMSYVFERIVGKTSNDDMAKAFNQTDAIVSTFGKINENDTEVLGQALSIIQADQSIKDRLQAESREMYERRIAELTRERDLEHHQRQFSRIDAVREQKLISMSAPLVSEMATTLRKSANTLEVFSNDNESEKRKILYLNQSMAREIELSSVDDDITAILVDIIQYNKETGWGKARVSGQPQPLSFNVPSDIKTRIQPKLLASMDQDKAYIQTYYVRDKANQPIRLIIVGVLPTPTE